MLKNIYFYLNILLLGLLSFIFLKKKKTTVDCRHRLMAHSHGDTIIIHYSPLRSCILVNAATTVTTAATVTLVLSGAVLPVPVIGGGATPHLVEAMLVHACLAIKLTPPAVEEGSTERTIPHHHGPSVHNPVFGPGVSGQDDVNVGPVLVNDISSQLK